MIDAAEALVSIDGLGKRYGSFVAVDDLDLRVREGEIVALLGPNGAGKTTTIRMLMGILQPTSGGARIHGLDCFAERAEVKRYVGYLPDDPFFHDHLRGDEIVRFVAGMHGLAKSDWRVRADALVERFDLTDAMTEFAVNYSMGMRKKLGLILALLHEPKLIILDEPTAGLDPFATRSLFELIRERAAEGVAIFYSTHLLDQAERVCHRVGILHQGRLAADAPLGELRDRMSAGGTLEDVFFQVAGGVVEAKSEEPTPSENVDGAASGEASGETSSDGPNEGKAS